MTIRVPLPHAHEAQGFTLIELLIVIAIIGVLSAVLIPNLLQAKAKANDTAAASIARKIATTAAAVQVNSNAWPSCTYTAPLAVLTAGTTTESVTVGGTITNIACTTNASTTSLDVTVTYSGGTQPTVTTTIE